jgi:peptide/nickel transport system substrate-binding protein
MKQKSILLIALLVLVAGAAYWWFGSRQTSSDGKDVIFVAATETDLTTLDPIKNLDPHIVRVQAQIFESLVGLNENNELIPTVAESWEPVDGFSKWRFKIREGVLFHPSSIFGQPGTRAVTPKDVVFSFQRSMGEGSSIGWILEGTIRRLPDPANPEKPGTPAISAVSESEVEFELTAPDPFFPSRLTSTPLTIMPTEIASLPDGDFGVNNIIGTGPFLVKSRTDSEVVLEKNSNHRDASVGNIGTLVFRVIKNDQIRLQELQNEQIQFARMPSSMASGIVTQTSDGYAATGAASKLKASAADTFNVVALGFNSERMDLPLRHAVDSAINRAELVKLIPQGLALPASNILPTVLAAKYDLPPRDPFSLTTAKDAWSQSNSPAKSAPLEILVHDKDNSEELGQIVQAQLKAAGIDSNLVKLDYNAVIGRMISGEFTMFIMGFEFTFPEAAPILDMNYNPAKIPVPNFWRYNNPDVTQALEAFRNSADPSRTQALVARIDGATSQDPPAAFLLHNRMFVLFSQTASHVPINGQSMPHFWKVRVE